MENNTNTTTTPATFEVGARYQARFATSWDTVLTFEVIKRTAKFVTVANVTYGDPVDERRCGVKVDAEGEWIEPLGRYSMAPVLRAARPEVAR